MLKDGELLGALHRLFRRLRKRFHRTNQAVGGPVTDALDDQEVEDADHRDREHDRPSASDQRLSSIVRDHGGGCVQFVQQHDIRGHAVAEALQLVGIPHVVAAARGQAAALLKGIDGVPHPIRFHDQRRVTQSQQISQGPFDGLVDQGKALFGGADGERADGLHQVLPIGDDRLDLLVLIRRLSGLVGGAFQPPRQAPHDEGEPNRAADGDRKDDRNIVVDAH